MNQVLFNFHDVILLGTAMMCAFFSALLLGSDPTKRRSNYLLAAFLFLHALIALNELILWGSAFKLFMREHFPHLNFVFSFANYLDGPMLYFYVRSLAFRKFNRKYGDLIHFIPLMIYVAFMVLCFYRLPAAARVDLIINETFTYSSGYVFMDLFCQTLRAIYCIACLHMIDKYKLILRATRSNINESRIWWLYILVAGFMLVNAFGALVTFAKIIGAYIHIEFQHSAFNIYEMFGLAGYYAGFLLTIVLIFSSMNMFTKLDVVKRRDGHIHRKNGDENLFNEDVSLKIDGIMRQQKPYLNPDLTSNELAKILHMRARDLSMYINRHLESNFWEFVNAYRIEEAKQIFEKNREKTITDVYLEAGFNSKSVFNGFFKKRVGMTPTAFRQKLLNRGGENISIKSSDD